MKKPVTFYNSLRWRFSALFVALVATSGLLQLYFSTSGWRELVEVTEQQIHWDLAADLAERIQPQLRENAQIDAVQQLLFSLTVANPKMEFVILDAKGKIIVGVPYRRALARKRISLAPIKRALLPQQPRLPLVGDDPFQDGGEKIFSVAPIVYNNQPAYLYIPLMSSTYDFLVRNTGQFYLIRIVAIGLAISWCFAIIAGFLVFAILSRRFARFSDAIAKVQSGEPGARVSLTVDDELGRLGEAFNEMAETIAQNTEELQKKDKLRRTLIANISHDLRGPVTSMIAHLDTIFGRALSDTEKDRYLGIIYEHAQSQNRLVEDLFGLASLEANEQKPDKDFCSLGRIVSSVVSMLALAAEKKDVSVLVDCPDDLPLIYADSRMIQRILANLMGNSIRYTLKGGKVTLLARAQAGTVCIELSDTGIGIPKTELPYIFDSFYRANKHRPEDPGGTGLGLAIVKKLLELHDSVATVTSEENQGTKFTFSLATSD